MSSQLQSLLAELSGQPKLGDVKKRGKEIKKDHELALALWASGDFYPRMLATLIFDKKQLSEAFLETIADDMLSHQEQERNHLGDWMLANQLSKDKQLVALMETWCDHPSPVMRRWYWYHQARLRWMGRTPPPANSAELLARLEANMSNEVAEVQWAMNFCAGQIGIFEPALRPRCIALGERSGLYKDEKVAKNCTPNYLPEFIRIEVAKRQ